MWGEEGPGWGPCAMFGYHVRKKGLCVRWGSKCLGGRVKAGLGRGQSGRGLAGHLALCYAVLCRGPLLWTCSSICNWG